MASRLEHLVMYRTAHLILTVPVLILRSLTNNVHVG